MFGEGKKGFMEGKRWLKAKQNHASATDISWVLKLTNCTRDAWVRYFFLGLLSSWAKKLPWIFSIFPQNASKYVYYPLLSDGWTSLHYPEISMTDSLGQPGHSQGTKRRQLEELLRPDFSEQIYLWWGWWHLTISPSGQPVLTRLSPCQPSEHQGPHVPAKGEAG